MAKSFRLQFVDLDSSYTINTTEAAVKGYIVVRAPKGTTEAMYFNYGNEKAINAMIGLPTANWIDLYEAVAFNQEYGLYISAPPGTDEDYPSYYGGVYFTTRGPFDYWQVSDASEPSFEVCIHPGSEKAAWDPSSSTSEISIERLSTDSASVTKQGLIKISKIPADVFAKTKYINLNYWGYDTCPVDAGIVTYSLDGTVTQGKLYYVDPDDGVIKDTYCGIYRLVGSTYDIWLGGDSSVGPTVNNKVIGASTNTPTSVAPYLSFKNLMDYEALRSDVANSVSVTVASKLTKPVVDTTNDLTVEQAIKNVINDNSVTISVTTAGVSLIAKVSELPSTITEIGYSYTKTISVNKGEFMPFNDGVETHASNAAIEKYLKTAILNGLSAETTLTTSNNSESITVDAFAGIDLGDRFSYRTNIKDITFCRIHQKSPNETSTYVSVTNIGYDKWQYDFQAACIDKNAIAGKKALTPKEIEDAETNGTDPTPSVYTTGKDTNISNIVLAPALQTAIIANNTDGIVMVYSNDTNLKEEKRLAVYKLASDTGLLTDVTSAYKTQRVYINGQITADFTTKVNADDGYTYTEWEVVSSDKKGLGNHKIFKCSSDDNAKYKLKKDINYNTLTVSCKEIVYPGSYTSGGEFTGSLSETGVDSFGSNIYWPNILPEDTVTFMEVVPVATFDQLKAVNDLGFFTGTKIVDPIGPAKDVYQNYLNGQRYCTHVNEENQENGVLGSTWCDGYYQIIKDGLIEAQSPDYEDALVFMEPTGYEDYKSLLMSLRVKYHDTSTVISPKIITKAELMNPATITVSGRSKGTAQYIGEFKKYDTYTGKYYYCQPIGDVGLQLARIMDKKMGGIAPAGTNDSAGLGGCLARSVLSAKWKFSDEALEILDQKGLCAITYDADNGLMIQSQKSTQDPSTVTDWSYLGHSMSFDLCKREIRDKVMVNQVFKRINQYWMDIRTKQVQAILDKRTTGNDPIWATATVDISGQNTPQTMAKRQFVIKVTCKVYVYSETVLLIFENLAQE